MNRSVVKNQCKSAAKLHLSSGIVFVSSCFFCVCVCVSQLLLQSVECACLFVCVSFVCACVGG